MGLNNRGLSSVNQPYDDPLVSVVIVSYNSSKYIIEALESVKNQTYNNIELIITDDCSLDDSVNLCIQWLGNNKYRFKHADVVTSQINSGISANCNRGVFKTKGDWIKLVAGDDFLERDCLERCISHIKHFPNIEILATQVEIFENTFAPENSRGIMFSNWESIKILMNEPRSDLQLEYILSGKSFPTPGIFFRKKLFETVGGYDIEYKLIEDIPFHLKLLSRGYKIFFKPIVTTKYRKHSDNMTSTNGSILSVYFSEYYKALLGYSRKHGKSKFIINNLWHHYLVVAILFLGNRGRISYWINYLRIKLQPLRIYNLFNKINSMHTYKIESQYTK